MELKIGPYKISKRTEYSKIKIMHEENKELIGDPLILANVILEDYKKQEYCKNDYFDIRDNKLIGIKRKLSEDNIHYIFIPNEVSVIGAYAFEGEDPYLVSFPEELKEIGSYAFYRCDNLQYAVLPPSVEKIGEGAFESCLFLSKVNIPQINAIPNRLFYECLALREVNIPDTVKIIGRDSFYNCARLSNIKLSENLTIIGESAFRHCISLSKIDLPESLTVINEHAFSSSALEEIIIPNNTLQILNGAFSRCKKLKYVKLPDRLGVLHEKLFSECLNLRNLTIPDTVYSIGEHVFEGADKIESINLPKDLVGINAQPFGKSAVKEIKFSHNLNDLQMDGRGLISNSDIHKLIIDKSVTHITDKAFRTGGQKITEIEYLGTKAEFEEFKKNNEKLFDCLPNAKKIDLVITDHKGNKYRNSYEDIEK